MTEKMQRGLGSKARRFIVVGLFGTAVDMTTFFILTNAGVAGLPANIGAWMVAVSFSYVLNSRWSFERSDEISEARSILRFVSMGALISLGISSAFLAAFTDLMGLWPAKILGTAVAAVLNFIAARWSIENRVK